MAGDAPRELLVVDGQLQCPHCGSDEINEKVVQSEWNEVCVSMTYMVEGVAHYSLDRKSIDVEDVEEPQYSCKQCEESLALPENVTP